MKLSYKTYSANRAEIVNTILHWQRILNHEEPATRHNCPLCQKYNNGSEDNCVGCPIYEITGKPYCVDTPFTMLAHHHQTSHHDKPVISNDCPICEDLINQEIQFLRSLHPFKPGDNVQITRTWTEDEDRAYNTGILYNANGSGIITNTPKWGNCKIDEYWYPPVVLAIIPPHKSPHKSHQPKAQISYKQSINRGRKEIVITGFYNILDMCNLPTDYVAEAPYFYKTGDTRIYSSKYDYINVGDAYSVQRFDDIMAHLHECSARLHTINEQLQIENAGWEGVEKTIDI